ncbi:uncharacterized protein LOC131855416 [Achroia grisella]|uniref:uncharacterized protein LOC131855416 n=1 Tax=Achroia grisella TaxID=688607 RepID=UPI0027D23980|nr:uncharacterized protein LOC131855416 [Achroia grisella]
MLHFEHSNATSTANILSGSSVTATTSRAVDLSSHSSHTQPAVGGGGGGRPAPCTDRAPHSPPPTPVVSRASEDVALCTLSDNVNKNMPRVPTTVLLATARVLMIDRDGNEHYIRALLDSASQNKITERLPTVSVDISLFSNFKNLPLADDSYATPGNIDMLIGASIFPHLILSRKVKGQPAYVSPYAIETVLGFVIVGSAPARSNTDTSVSNMLDNCNYTTTAHCCVTEPTMESVLCRFWEMEEVNVAPILSPDDKECEAIYAGTTTREDDGRYTVALPFKGNAHSLGDSRRLAEKCFFCLERKMQASPELKQAYDDVITEYLDKSYISPAPVNDDSNAPSYIIPHHGVIRKDKLTSKLRVVLNASAKTSTSVSLNDLLYNGQNLQRNLFDIIVNFRLFSVALSADIRQMFLCIRIRESDRRFQRILYRFSPDEPLQVYQFNRVCFGLKSSPFLALRTIKQLATDEGESFPKAKEAVHTGLYMDDLVYCLDSEDEAIVTAAEIISLMKAGQFDLVKWTSNSQRHVDITKRSVVNIIGFADASEKAYGAVVYFHVENDGVSTVHLISAKSKVAPRKVVSLARLELCAALLLANLINNIVTAVNNRYPIKAIHAFSDSTVALCWIHASPHRWDTFVANRVSKIQSLLSPHNFYHVSGSDNPADCLSRGLTPAQIIHHPLWFNGPQWAKSTFSEWPVTTFNPSAVMDPPEEKKLSFVTRTPPEESVFIALANRFSSWSKLLRCVVYVCRFAKLLTPLKFITAADLDYAELVILRELQALYFHGEINNLQNGKFCSRSLQRLKPFILEGIIRVGGRLRNSNLNFDQKHPIVLPRKHHILDLLVDYHHKVNCHAGPDLLMSILRQKYWILSARNLIRHRVHKCVPCFKLRPKSTFPEMSDHKPCRVLETLKPFMHTGTDYAGPFKITITRGRGIRSTKAYICLFVCLTTRAVHIELAGDLSTASFMSALKRFLSRRGPVAHIYSDNGTNYIGAKRTLSELHAFLSSKHFNTEFAHVLSENRLTWFLNTPAASHFGGNWETNIKSLKTHLFRVVGVQVLSFEEMITVLTQVEAIMNTRPLCRTLSNDPSEPLALTPAHFLNFTPLKYLPAAEIADSSLISRHALLDRLVQTFWKRWRAEYLHTLQSREKWNTPVNQMTVGTVVIVRTENAPPLHWPLGVIEEVFPASDGVIRVVRVKTATGSYLRPVVRLCPLPRH